jgi:outer membrane lipoprotein-sorting protein
MKKVRRTTVWSMLLTASLWTISPVGAEGLDRILTEMDRVGQRLKSMAADIEQRKWTDILGEYDEGERGRFLFLREDGQVLLRKEIAEPTVNTLVVREGKVLFYQPSIKQAQEYRLGRHGDKAEFLLLGFGADKEELSQTYEISLLGEEDLDGRHTYKLELKPRSDQVSAFFVRIFLWVDSERWVPVRQQLVEPTRDHILIAFRNITLNPRLSRSNFDVRIPRDVEVIRN